MCGAGHVDAIVGAVRPVAEHRVLDRHRPFVPDTFHSLGADSITGSAWPCPSVARTL